MPDEPPTPDASTGPFEERPDGSTQPESGSGPPKWTDDPNPREPLDPPAFSHYRAHTFHKPGGMGRVWRATDAELGRDVAFKEIRPLFADDDVARRRFTFEAEVTGRLDHPAVIPVYGFGRADDGRPFYAMRFVEGRSLGDAVEAFYAPDGPSGAARALELRRLLAHFVTVCRAVDYAHSKGIIHRDLKPANVMVGSFGETLVVDWGIAKRLRSGAADAADADAPFKPLSSRRGTIPGRGFGSPPFWAPEQADGKPDEHDERTDVYGLGAVLYAILTGGSPHPDGEHGAEPPSPRAACPWVDAGIDAIVRKALALRREDRYQTAAAVAEAVELWLADQPLLAQRGAVEALEDAAKKRPSDHTLAEQLARQRSSLGLMLSGMGRDADAAKELRVASDEFARLFEQRGKPRYLAEEANCLLALSRALGALGQAESERAFQVQAAELYRRLIATNPDEYKTNVAEIMLTWAGAAPAAPADEPDVMLTAVPLAAPSVLESQAIDIPMAFPADSDEIDLGDLAALPAFELPDVNVPGSNPPVESTGPMGSLSAIGSDPSTPVFGSVPDIELQFPQLAGPPKPAGSFTSPDNAQAEIDLPPVAPDATVSTVGLGQVRPVSTGDWLDSGVYGQKRTDPDMAPPPASDASDIFSGRGPAAPPPDYEQSDVIKATAYPAGSAADPDVPLGARPAGGTTAADSGDLPVADALPGSSAPLGAPRGDDESIHDLDVPDEALLDEVAPSGANLLEARRTSSGDFELPDVSDLIAQAKATPKDDGAVDWDAVAEGEEEARGIPRDASLSALTREHMEQNDSPTQDATDGPEVSIDWGVGESAHAAVPPSQPRSRRSVPKPDSSEAPTVPRPVVKGAGSVPLPPGAAESRGWVAVAVPVFLASLFAGLWIWAGLPVVYLAIATLTVAFAGLGWFWAMRRRRALFRENDEPEPPAVSDPDGSSAGASDAGAELSGPVVTLPSVGLPDLSAGAYASAADFPLFELAGTQDRVADAPGPPLDLLETTNPTVEAALEAPADGPNPPTLPAGAPASAVRGAELPRAMGGYTLLGELARGGMGATYLARDNALGRRVVIKALRPEAVARPDAVERFVNEVRVTAALEHPGVVRVHASGRRDDGAPFMVMECLNGVTLLRMLDAHGHGWSAELLGPLAQVCDALHFAHGRGVVHRDAKLANVIVTTTGRTVLLDWGIAKVIGRPDADPSDPDSEDADALRDLMLTRAGSVMGTPAYMSPEQARGEPGAIGPRTDVFTVGAGLFHLVTGRPPTRPGEDGMNVIRRLLAGDIPRLRDARPDVPPELDAICSRAMAFRPEDRYPTAAALAADIRAFLASQK